MLEAYVSFPCFFAKLYPCLSSTYPFLSSSTPSVPFTSASLIQSASFKSGWIVAIPWSKTATMTRGSPAVSFHASLTATSAPATDPSSEPSFIMSHWSLRSRSLNGRSDDPAFVTGAPTYSMDAPVLVEVSTLLYSIASTSPRLESSAAAFSGDIAGSNVRVYHLSRPYFAAVASSSTWNTGLMAASSSPSNTCAASNVPSLMVLTASDENLIKRVPSSFSPLGLPTSLAVLCCGAMLQLSSRHAVQQAAAAVSIMNILFI